MKMCSGKTCLITGASMGIGASLSQELAARGARLILVARSTDKLNDLSANLKTKYDIEITIISMDLAQPGAGARLYDDISVRGLTVDLLVNNAGFGKWGHFTDVDAATYADMIELNIQAVVDLCHAFLPGMAARGDCGILNVGSVASYVPIPWSAVYAATKAFILSFSEALSYEYRDRGVQVTCVCPGSTASHFAAVANANAARPAASDDSPDMVARVALDALLAGKYSVISGGKNQILGILPKVLPRRAALRLIGTAWKRILKSRGVVV